MIHVRSISAGNTGKLPGDGDAAVTVDSVVPQVATYFDKIVVAIHGIGSQDRSGTIRTIASRFGDRCKPPFTVQPLGYFNVAVRLTLVSDNSR